MNISQRSAKMGDLGDRLVDVFLSTCGLVKRICVRIKTYGSHWVCCLLHCPLCFFNIMWQLPCLRPPLIPVAACARAHVPRQAPGLSAALLYIYWNRPLPGGPGELRLQLSRHLSTARDLSGAGRRVPSAVAVTREVPQFKRGDRAETEIRGPVTPDGGMKV